MKIAIHHKVGTFSDRWIEYCKSNNIEYKIVNAYDSDIVSQVADCDAFMWHHHHGNPKDVLFAKQLLYSIEESGKKVFPNWHTCWHFDDKVGQKYLLEAVGAPLVPSYVFYTKAEAYEWIKKTSFPKVFKLRGGAGASNVKLVKSASQARKLVRKAFGRGFSQFDRIGYLKDRFNKWRHGKDSIIGVFKGFGRLFIPTEFAKKHAREKGYVYFQDFIPNNDCDYRIVVIGDKILAEKRYVREGDFRASGSGVFEYTNIPQDILRIAFETAEKLQLQSVAFDFVLDNGKPMIIEMSYGFGTKGIAHCPGYYTRDYKWHESKDINFWGWMVENLINK